MQPPSRTTCILPSNRRKICAVSFVVTAAWYSILYILGSLGDTNCTVVDCEPWITVPAWATIIPLLAFPVGWADQPGHVPRCTVLLKRNLPSRAKLPGAHVPGADELIA
jgi:hypothetical protein